MTVIDVIIETIIIIAAIVQIIAGSVYIFRVFVKKKTKVITDKGNVKIVEKRKSLSSFSKYFRKAIYVSPIFFPIFVFIYYIFLNSEPLTIFDKIMVILYLIIFISGIKIAIRRTVLEKRDILDKHLLYPK